MPVPGLGPAYARPVVFLVFVLAGKKAVVAVFALLDVDNHMPLFHYAASPLYFSTWTRQELPAWL
jgi:hypothetical protein